MNGGREDESEKNSKLLYFIIATCIVFSCFIFLNVNSEKVSAKSLPYKIQTSYTFEHSKKWQKKHPANGWWVYVKLRKKYKIQKQCYVFHPKYMKTRYFSESQNNPMLGINKKAFKEGIKYSKRYIKKHHMKLVIKHYRR